MIAESKFDMLDIGEVLSLTLSVRSISLISVNERASGHASSDVQSR